MNLPVMLSLAKYNMHIFSCGAQSRDFFKLLSLLLVTQRFMGSAKKLGYRDGSFYTDCCQAKQATLTCNTFSCVNDMNKGMLYAAHFFCLVISFPFSFYFILFQATIQEPYKTSFKFKMIIIACT